ncbi:MAG: PilW family protein [Gammaproteobacteria bacterium]|nr:PilW family protein [Gammaproteobacteria bacterium]MBU4004908.1 PilW family protein [Gammaproteobacteria bacterium]MBU4020501.1 PilW family protein [Gammaproteobacteria bacterium]MBU4095577.1 PilW family protein [Gammaproteobacteria bacterium]MBU4146262.1 PilW family protein [Gammaproteobacteria bacterium]
MAIGLLLVLVITQVMGAFEARNRATMGNADAQTNGGIALYSISRDLQMAGYSLIPDESSPLECATLTSGVAGITTIAPITLVNGTATSTIPDSDSITIRYGNSIKGGALSPITANPVGNNLTVSNNFGCKVNDIALIVSGNTCFLTTVTGPADIATPPVASSPPNTTMITVQNPAGAAPNSNIACLGTWNQITYAVSNGNLTRNGVPLLAGIVNLQAQYGISATANSNQVNQWVDATNTWATPSLADRNRIKALRVAVIARNDKMDTTTVTSACSSIDTASPTGLCAWAGNGTSPAPTVNLSPGDANWNRYRYRVFETIAPLRNIVWSKDTL